MDHIQSLVELTCIGARMMLQVALEEELKAFLGRDYYERREDQKGSRSGSKPRSIKIGCGDIHIQMPQARGGDTPFHSKFLPPYPSSDQEKRTRHPLT
jgi:transposase-like protein